MTNRIALKDCGKIDYNKICAKYAGFQNTWNNAFVGFPQKSFNIDADFIGCMADTGSFVAIQENVPVIIYAHGSGKFCDQIYQESLTEAGYLFIAPNSHEIEGRPTYNGKVSVEIYEEIHAIRQAEIGYAVEKVLEFEFTDKSNLFLMGSSEGGLAAARYPGNEFKGRVVIGWSCEKGYFTDNPKIGANKKDPFLNIVGYKDEYFGVDAVWNQNQNKTGNCAQQMSSDGFDKGKIIIYPDGYHNNRENQYIVSDILGFLNYWKGRRVLKD